MLLNIIVYSYRYRFLCDIPIKMTDQTQSQDPQTQDDQNLVQDQNQDTGVFGGSDDIFENSDILEPIEDLDKKDENIVETEELKTEDVTSDKTIGYTSEWMTKIENSMDTENKIEEEKKPEIVESMPSMIHDIKDNENMDDDFFDPFNDEDEDVKPKKDVPNFDTSPEIDALDDLHVEELNEIKKEKNEEEISRNTWQSKWQTEDKVEEVRAEEKKPEIDIMSTIERIERRANAANKKVNDLVKETVWNNDVNQNEELEEIEEVEEIKEVEKKIEKTDTEDSSVVEIVENIVVEDKKIDTQEVNPLKTDLVNKFEELLRKTKGIYDMMDKKEWFELLWWNDDRTKTTYNMAIKENAITIQKTELNKSDDSKNTNQLEFVLNAESLNVKIDGEMLYDEVSDLQDNPNKKMQVMEKLNKFIFLVSEEYKKMEKEKAELEAQKEKKNKMKWIFRNFMF